MTLRQRWAALSRRRRRTVIAALAIGLYALAGFVIVPAILRAKVPALLAETLGRPVTIESIRLNPFALSLGVHGLRVDDTDGQPFVSFNDLYVNVQSSSIFRRALTLEAVALTAPQIRLRVLPDGKPSFVDIEERLASSGDSSQPPPEPSEPFPVVIRHARIERGSVTIRDESRPTPFEETIEPIDIAVDDFATRRDGETDSPYSFGATTANGATLTWEGTISILPVRSRGEIRLVNFRSRTPWLYLRDDLRFEITSGWADVSAKYAFDASGDNPSLQISDAALALQGITLFEEGTSGPLITLPSFVVSGGAIDLQNHTVTIASVTSHGARTRMTREADGRLHLEKVFARRERENAAASGPAAAAPSAPPPVSTPAATSTAGAPLPWSVTIDSIDISDYGVDFQDETMPTPARLAIAPIALRMSNVSTSASKPGRVDLRVGLDGAGTLSVTGDVSPKDTSADLAIKLERFALPTVQPYLAAASGATIRQGELTVDMTVRHGPAAATTATSCTGRLDLTGLDIGTKSGGDVLRLDALAIEGVNATLSPLDLKIAKIDLSRPNVHFDRRADGSNNFAEAAGAPPVVSRPEANATPEPLPTQAEQPTPTATERPNIHIGRIEIIEGSVNVTDAGAPPGFALHVTDLAASADDVALDPAARIGVDMKARIERTSSLAIHAVAAPMSKPTDAKLKLSLVGLDTAVFSPYSGRYIGQQIARGKLDLDLDYTVERSKLDAKNKVLLDGFTLGKRVESADAVDLPVGLAVALLKDTHGRIKLDVPASGRLDEPGFRLSGVILDTMKNVILKAATAPFALIGGLVGGGEDLGYVAFAPGRADLAETERAKLSQLARGLAERPALAVEVPGAASPTLDGPALREIALESLLQSMRFEEIRGKSGAPAIAAEVELDDDLRERLIAEAYATRLKQRVKALRAEAPTTDASGLEVDPREWTRDEMRRRLLNSFSVGPGELDELARRRAKVIADALLKEKGVTPQRVSTVAPNLGAVGDGLQVKTEFVLAPR